MHRFRDEKIGDSERLGSAQGWQLIRVASSLLESVVAPFSVETGCDLVGSGARMSGFESLS